MDSKVRGKTTNQQREARGYSPKELALIGILLLSLLIQGIVVITTSSLTTDEVCYVGAGKAIVETGNMRNNALVYHPPLSYYIGSLLLFPLDVPKETWQGNDCWEMGKRFVFHSGNDPEKIVFLSRLPFLALAIVLGLYILTWASRLYGKRSGILALFLYSFSPPILAYSSIATTDFTVAAMMLISLYYFWRWISEKSWKHCALAGIFLGLALCSKITSIILIPSYAIISLTLILREKRKWRGALAQYVKGGALMGLLAFCVIFTLYGFQFDTLANSYPPEHYAEKAREQLADLPFSTQLLFIYDSIPLPASSYIAEFGNLLYISSQSNSGYAFGKVTDNPPWYFMLVTFFLKANIALLVLILGLGILWNRLPMTDSRALLCLLIPLLLLFINFALSAKSSGVRHILFAYLIVFVLVSNIINAKVKEQLALKLGVGVLLFYYLASTLLIAPHYASYVNEMAGGPLNAHKVFVGSNIDLGQDLKFLRSYMENKGIETINLSYFGATDPSDYGISYEYMPSPAFFPWVPDYTILSSEGRQEDCKEQKGWIAVSITNLKGVYLENKSCFAWLEGHEPIARAGYSINIYHLP